MSRLGMQGVHEAEVVSKSPQVGQQFGNHFAGFPAWFEIPKGLGNVPRRTLEGYRGNSRWFLAMILNEFGLVIKSIDMTDRTGTKDNEYLFGRPFEMSIPGSVGIVGINVRPDGFFAGEAGRVIRRKKPVFA